MERPAGGRRRRRLGRFLEFLEQESEEQVSAFRFRTSGSENLGWVGPGPGERGQAKLQDCRADLGAKGGSRNIVSLVRCFSAHYVVVFFFFLGGGGWEGRSHGYESK